MSEKGEKFKVWLRNSLGYASIAALALAYTAMSLFMVGKTGKTIDRIISDGLTYLLLGIAMERLFSLQGMMNGELDPRVQSTAALHGKTVESIAPYMDKLDEFCVRKTKEALKTARERLLLREGLSYSHCFSEEGVALGYPAQRMPQELEVVEGESRSETKRRKKQRRAWKAEESRRHACYLAAVRMSVTPLVSGALTGISGNRDDPYDFGETKAQHEVVASRKSAVWRIVTAVLFGYYGVQLVQEFSYQELILRIFQVALAIAMGVVQLYRGYMFVVEEQRGKTIRKIDTLQMFAADMRRVERVADEARSREDALTKEIKKEEDRENGE